VGKRIEKYQESFTMNRIIAVGIGIIASATLSAAQPGQAQRERAPGTDQEITVTGCVQSETEYRKMHDKGRAGPAGTGLGASNEFVLINATISRGRAMGSAYELSGASESKVAAFLGKRVEVTGKLKPGEVTASGAPTGGASAGSPPRGVDVVSKDLKLRELEVLTVKASTDGSCTP
jgi:hypothetical protein